MRYLCAYLLLQIGGNEKPSAADIKALLKVQNIDVDEDRLKTLISELEGKSISELIAEGSAKLSSVPSGGGGGGGGAPAAGGAAPAAAVEEKKEEKEEEKEESDDDMGFGLFD